jgi:predicted DCC family thiol-disulfide oxidoreductase YuxK
MTEQTIIFFDGVCGLCNRTVDFVLKEDREGHFLFSPLQGETFQRIARNYPETVKADSIFVLRCNPKGEEELLLRSDAILYILSKLPRSRWLGRLGYICPGPIRNFLYRLIAATRYPIWGKRDSCRLPTSEEKTRFLP